MAGSDTIALNFKLSGEDDFKRALADINNQLKVNQSEMSLTSTKYAENAKSIQALKDKSESLKNTLDTENQKIKTLQEGIEKATASHAAAGSQIEKLKTQLAEAKTQMDAMSKSSETSKEDLLKQQNTIKDLNSQLKNAEKAYQSTGRDVTNWSSQLNKSQEQVIKLNKELSENEKQLKKVDVNTNTFSGKLNDLGNNISTTDEKLGGGLTKSIEAFGLAAVAAGGLAVKSFLDFDEQMSKVKTLMDDSSGSIEELKNSIIDISKATAQSANDVATATYNALSAGIKTADIENFMAQAGKTAVAGNTDVSTSVDILTTILNSYGMKEAEVSQISDELLLAQDKGKLTVGQLSDGLGNLVGVSANAGVSLKEILAAIAALTAGGLPASSAITSLKAAISNIIKPTTEATNEAKKLHIQFNTAALESKGLSGVLADVKRATGGSAEQMAQLFGSTEALNAVMSLAGGSNKNFTDTLKGMNNAAGKTDEVFNKVSSDTGFKFKQSLESLKDTAIQVGDSLTPLINLISGIISAIGAVPAPVLIAVGSIILAINATLKIITAINSLAGMGGTLGAFFGGLNVNSIKTTAIILGVVAALIALAAIIAVIIGKSQEMNSSLSNLGNTVNKVKSSAMDEGTTAANGIRQRSVSSLPSYATGTNYHPGGPAIINDGNGYPGEIVDLPTGSRVYPHGSNAGTQNVFTGNIIIDAHSVKEWNDVYRLASQQAEMMAKEG